MNIKVLVISIIFLFIGMSINLSRGNITFYDDTTPPVTTYTLDPPEPDGLNSWYISEVNITLNATDDLSGVNETYYKIDNGTWNIYSESFIIKIDGYHVLEFYSVDNAGNIEDLKSVEFKIDKTAPKIDLKYEVTGGNAIDGWEFTFTATATDKTSGMDYVEFWINDDLQETVIEHGPEYSWTCVLFHPCCFSIRGLIRNLEITDEFVRFYAIIVFISGRPLDICAHAHDKAGNWDKDCTEKPKPPVITPQGITLFKNFKFPKNYEGYIGKYLIWANFKCYES